MLKFAFLLTMWTGEDVAPKVYVEDFGMTGEDCIAALESYVAGSPDQSAGVGSCEVDSGEPWDELPESGIFGTE